MELDHLNVWFQPIVNAATTGVVGAEALVRWNDDERGMLMPGDFIPIAEETGMIVDLGGYVMRRACVEAATWPPIAPGVYPSVSVNVSAAQLTDGVLLKQIDEALAVSGLAANRLAIELTESTLAQVDDAKRYLSAIRKQGVRVEIDDFGTGYSSFSYLTNFPVDTVKIDKSFVDRIAGSVDDAAITQAIIQMAHSLRLTVVAEGIETTGQLEVLRTQGCDDLQGYLFARPMPGIEFSTWLGRHAARSAVAETTTAHA